ncbi:hypothetical protein BST61_g8430 [Cercospora zeina]
MTVQYSGSPSSLHADDLSISSVPSLERKTTQQTSFSISQMLIRIACARSAVKQTKIEASERWQNSMSIGTVSGMRDIDSITAREDLLSGDSLVDAVDTHELPGQRSCHLSIVTAHRTPSRLST